MARYIDAETALKIIDNYAKTVTADGIVVVKAIRDIVEIITPTADVVPKSDADNLIEVIDNTTQQFLALHDLYQNADREVKRLHDILLQFTDIVHKWGAKNNIDTSEISLVPILQEEADSIIKKANQELASEIFAEIERLMLDGAIGGKYPAKVINPDKYAEFKKKYTEGEK